MEKRDKGIILCIRLIHIIVTIFLIFSIIYLYYAAFTRRFGYFLFIPLGALIAEAVFLIYNKGNCPMTRIHKKYGDEKGFWDLFLPKTIVPYITKTLEIITIIGFILVILRFIGVV